jgi:hypothetical protein
VGQFTQNGITYEELPGGKVRVVGYAIGNPDPMKQLDIAGKSVGNQGQALQNVRTQQQIQSQPLQNENTAVNIEQGRASVQNQHFNQVQGLRQEFNNLPEVKAYSDAVTSLGGALKAPDTPQGDLSIVYSYAKAMDPGSVVREGEMSMANSTASQTQQLQQYINSIQSGKRLPPAVRTGLIETMRQRVSAMRQTYDQQRERYSDAAKANGFDAEQIVGKPLYDAVRPLEEQYIKAHGGTPRDPYAITPDLRADIATGKFRNQYDPQLSGQIDAMIRQGARYAQAVSAAQQAGYPAPDPKEYAAAVAYAKRNPGYRGSLAEANRPVPTTAFQRLAGGPVGAFVSGASKAATLGTADEIAGALTPGDYTTNRDAFAAAQAGLANQHPIADLSGQLVGGAATGLGINAAVSKIPGAAGGLFGARTPFPSLLNRGAVAGDAIYGAGYGAGSDNQDRLNGGLLGMGLGVGGGVAARGAVNGVASAISPTGGRLAPLYEMGVRPSIGQRLGGVANTFEEKLQSIPLAGDFIAGTRNRARDQYQVGLFNDSLGHLTDASGNPIQLPKGMGPGHEAHAFAQNAISQAYDKALSGMTARADQQLNNDLMGVQQAVGQLRGDSQTQFSKIWGDEVERRFQNGELSGEGFKDAESALKKKIAKLRSSPQGDGELADVLEQGVDALRGSAARHSGVREIMALGQADAAHAKIVRLENASRAPGGEPAEFSPKQYNNAVRTSSGGVRNREYLRGDALNSDIAALGTQLGDKVSNSNSIDRLLAGGALYGLNSVSPTGAAAIGAFGLLNAPGIRNATTELMAPRANPLFNRAAEQLRQRARLAGMFGAPLALDYYGNQ